jgi:hypothetical protein
LLLAETDAAESRSAKLLKKNLRDANVSVTLIAMKSRKESPHAETNSVVQFLALKEGDETRHVPWKPVKGRDEALVKAVGSALHKWGL